MKNLEQLDDHRSIEDLKKENLTLSRENHAAMQTITKLLKELNLKNEKINSLETLINQTVPVILPEPKKIQTSLTPEQEIADYQLERLRKTARDRVLTLEETRMFDLLVKNKHLSQEKSNKNLSKSTYRDVSEVELIQIANKSDEPSE